MPRSTLGVSSLTALGSLSEHRSESTAAVVREEDEVLGVEWEGVVKEGFGGPHQLVFSSFFTAMASTSIPSSSVSLSLLVAAASLSCEGLMSSCLRSSGESIGLNSGERERRVFTRGGSGRRSSARAGIAGGVPTDKEDSVKSRKPHEYMHEDLLAQILHTPIAMY